MVVELDVYIVQWLNQYAQKHPIFDALVVVINRYSLTRGVVMVSLLWWAWMNSRKRLVTEDLTLVKTVFGVLASIAVARGLQNMLPARLRPVHDPEVGFQLPWGFSGADAVLDWSSFPSDHAVLITALIFAVLQFNRLIGILALVWGVCVILLPRIYLGLHYPSDILAGAVVGVAIMATVQRITVSPGVAQGLARMEDQHRGLAYAAFFVFSYLCASMFNDVRELLRLLAELLELVSP
ncbi:MAG: phosphatase PAP2 family protein [Pseudomonadota bacterium]